MKAEGISSSSFRLHPSWDSRPQYGGGASGILLYLLFYWVFLQAGDPANLVFLTEPILILVHLFFPLAAYSFLWKFDRLA
jgi:hypothetical protein